MKLAMIGLGRMGANMTRRLMRGGHRCVVYDRDPAKVQDLVKEGAVGVGSLKELKAKLREEALKDIGHRVEQHRKKLQEKATEKLQGALAGVSQELDRVVNGVTREALKKKAASLGAIREISEDAEAGSLTIKVEV